jgi:hypothetical protein
MAFVVLGDDKSALDARFTVHDSATIIFHSRSGAKAKNPRNSQYEVGLRLLLQRLAATATPIDSVLVDSSRVQSLPIEQRRILTTDEAGLPPNEMYALLASRMKSVGQDAASSGGNSTRKIRIKLGADYAASDLLVRLNSASERLPASTLEKVTAEDLLDAVDQLLAGVEHPFGPSTDYDVLLDTGERLPPKAVFGVAATRALGFKVLPGHFTAGIDSPCFQALDAAGYKIVPKDAPSPLVPSDAADLEWLEGTPKLRAHMKKERASGLAAAKKAEFKRIHGKLFCELCNMDAAAVYGDVAGEACIEAHHSETQVQEMGQGHKTKLSHLQCLCANCHRVTHRKMKAAGR